MMPELDGFGLIKELRDDPRTEGIPIIMLSARVGEEASVEGLRAGADDYLVKPFNARELLARVRVCLQLANLRQDLSREEEKQRGAVEIERQWRLFDSALSHSPDAIYVFDPAMRFLYGNRALLERWQRPLAEILGKTMAEVGYPSDLSALLKTQFEDVIQSRAPLRDKASLIDRTGRKRQYDYILVPIFSNDGSLEAVAGSSRDITEFIETNQELREANSDLQRFAYSASHDLKAPLRVIDNASKWLEEDLQEHLTAETRDHLRLMRGRVKRMDKLLDDLLEYSRIGKTTAHRYGESMNGQALVDDVLALLSPENFTVRVSPQFAQIQLRRMPMQQILLNLVSNAIKHHHKKTGCVELTVEEQGEYYAFAVRDDGPGIAPQYHEQIFQMFQTLKPRGSGRRQRHGAYHRAQNPGSLRRNNSARIRGRPRQHFPLHLAETTTNQRSGRMKITQMLADKEDITAEQQSALWRGPHAPPPAGGREEYPQPFYAGTERSAKELASFLGDDRPSGPACFGRSAHERPHENPPWRSFTSEIFAAGVAVVGNHPRQRSGRCVARKRTSLPAAHRKLAAARLDMHAARRV
jgi:PAS domain S-box-containing protein